MELNTVDIDGAVHYHDVAGPSEDAPVIVLVHGLGASHLSWHPLIPRLTPTHRVVALDLVGFGHSEPAGRGTTVRENRDILARFIRQVVGGPVTLVGNSMGGMISATLAHAHPALVDALVLINPALPGALSPRGFRDVNPRLAMYFALYNAPVLGERFLRMRRDRTTPAEQVNDLLGMICTDPSLVPPETVDRLVALTAQRRGYAWSDSAFLAAERSLMKQLTVGRRRYLSILHGLRMPTLLVHGEDDRLVRVATAMAVAPGNPRIDLVTLPGVGHAPQLEVPDELAGIMLRWLAGAARQGVA